MSSVRPVLVGTDGMPSGRDAVALARSLADLLEAPLEVVSVRPYVPLSSRIGHDGWATRTYMETGQALDDARRQIGRRNGVTFRRVAASTPALGLDLAAEEAEAELVVVGSTARGAVGRVAPGSTAEQLFAHVRRPIALPPVGYADRPATTQVLGVAYDDGPPSRQALAYTRHLANGSRPQLRLIGVFDPAAAAYGVPANLDAARDQAYSRLAKAAGGVAEAELLEGHPLARLAEASDDLDLIVVGSDRRASPELLERSTCPVLVVPRTASRLS